MLEALAFAVLLALAFRLERRLPLWVLGIWLNLLFFVYQNELGSGWLAYLRGLGAGLFLAAGYGRPDLAWAPLPPHLGGGDAPGKPPLPSGLPQAVKEVRKPHPQKPPQEERPRVAKEELEEEKHPV